MRRPRILIAEDDRQLLDLYGVLLADAPFDVTLVADGEEAVEAHARAADFDRPFDLIILDVMMPVMSGPTAAETIRAADPAARIVFCTVLDARAWSPPAWADVWLKDQAVAELPERIGLEVGQTWYRFAPVSVQASPPALLA